MKEILLAALITIFVGTALLTSERGIPSLMKNATPLPNTDIDIDLLNSELMDQNGAEVKLVEDIVGDRIVAIDFIYTDCGIACPVVSAIFSKLQDQLEDNLNDKVRLISVSLNPIADTPEKLKTFAEKYHSTSGWFWLTGKKSNIDEVLTGLRVNSPNYIDHAPVIIVGDPVSGEWTRFNGLPSPETIKQRIDKLLDARNKLPS